MQSHDRPPLVAISVWWRVLPVPVRDAVVAALFAGVTSGVPSTLFAALTHGRLHEGLAAAGAILLGPEAPLQRLLVAGTLVHGFVSFFWAGVLTAILPRRSTALWGGAAGVAIAGLDLLLIGPRFESIEALPFLPQLLDHVLFGLVAGAVIGVREGRKRQ